MYRRAYSEPDGAYRRGPSKFRVVSCMGSFRGNFGITSVASRRGVPHIHWIRRLRAEGESHCWSRYFPSATSVCTVNGQGERDRERAWPVGLPGGLPASLPACLSVWPWACRCAQRHWTALIHAPSGPSVTHPERFFFHSRGELGIPKVDAQNGCQAGPWLRTSEHAQLRDPSQADNADIRTVDFVSLFAS